MSEDLFGLESDLEVITLEEKGRRSPQPYKAATVRPPTALEARASVQNIFGDDLLDKDPLIDLYVSQKRILEIKGSNGKSTVSSFTGCGGSATGFAWAGWDEICAVEFVQAARETLASNYESYIIDPLDVMEPASIVAESMGFKTNDKVAIEGEPTLVINPGRKRKLRGRVVDSSVNWEETIVSIGPDLTEEFRYRVNKIVFEKYSGAEYGNKMSIWGDDIRGLDPKALMEHSGLKRGELDCYEGSPPCKSFSTAGLREEGWGKSGKYSDERHQRTDDLFDEYTRMLKGLYPRSFVAENVQGIGMGAAEEQVMRPMMEEFDKIGYNVTAMVVNSKDYSVPQSRRRMLFVGIRKDQILKDTNRQAIYEWPSKHAITYTCQDALDAAAPHNTEAYLEPTRMDKKNPETGEIYETGKIWFSVPEGGSPENKAFQLIRCHSQLPVPTITATSAGNQPAAGPMHPHECRKFTIPEYKFLFSFPIDYVFTGTIDQQGERMGRSVPPYLMKCVAERLSDILDECYTDESYTHQVFGEAQGDE